MKIDDLNKEEVISDLETLRFYTEFYIYDNDYDKNLKKLNKVISSIKDGKYSKILKGKDTE